MISVAMTTCNGEKYIYDQLKSIQDQTVKPDEIIIFDDYSNDKTIDIIKNFINESELHIILFLNNERLGYSHNFSLALEKCSGDYVFLCDQDDIWMPNKIKIIIDQFETSIKTQLIIHDLEYCKEDMSIIGQTKIERMEVQYDLMKSYVVGMATAVRGSFLKICLPIPWEYGISHDTWLHECSNVVNGKMIIYEPLALYRRHSTNATNGRRLNSDNYISPYKVKSKKYTFKRYNKNNRFLKSNISQINDWLINKKDQLIVSDLLTLNEYEILLNENNKYMHAYELRINLAKLNRLDRVKTIFKLMFSGGYKYFNGWKSAIRDLLI